MEETKQLYLQAFYTMDLDRSGTVSVQELTDSLKVSHSPMRPLAYSRHPGNRTLKPKLET